MKETNPRVIEMQEPIAAWGDHLQKYYNAITSDLPLSLSQQQDIIAFEKIVALSRLQ